MILMNAKLLDYMPHNSSPEILNCRKTSDLVLSCQRLLLDSIHSNKRPRNLKVYTYVLNSCNQIPTQQLCNVQSGSHSAKIRRQEHCRQSLSNPKIPP